MQADRLIPAAAVVLAAIAFLPVAGQAPAPVGPGQGLRVASAGGSASGRIVREIDDPHTGKRWLLLSDPANSGGPGRLVVAPRGADRASGSTTSPAARQLGRALASLRPIIRAGDRIVVEEHSAIVDARLAAVALGPAGEGSFLAARLAIGGRVVRVLAVAPGRAEIVVESEEQP